MMQWFLLTGGQSAERTRCTHKRSRGEPCITDAHAALCVQNVMEDTSGEGKEQRQSLAMFVWQKGVCTKREERQERKKGYIILNMTLAVISLDFVEFSIGF